MNVSFLEAAQRELEAAVAFYETQRAGLGGELAQEIADALERIKSFPQAWTRLSARIRRCRTKRFEYGLVYEVRGDTVLIVAVMHLRQQPGYWQDRL